LISVQERVAAIMPMSQPNPPLDSGFDLGFIAKLLGLSLGISLGIKYLGPQVPLSPAPWVVLSMVLLPALALGLALGWRSWQQRRQASDGRG